MDSTQVEARGDDQSVVSSEPVTPLPQGDWQPVRRYPELTAAPHFTIFNYRETDLLQQVDFRIGRNVAIRSVDSLYSTKLYHTLMILYLVCFISEYLLGFLQLPFEYVKNRPVMCIINAIFDVIVVRTLYYLYALLRIDRLTNILSSLCLLWHTSFQLLLFPIGPHILLIS